MAGYAMIWLFAIVIALVFFAMALGYYAARSIRFLVRFWRGE